MSNTAVLLACKAILGPERFTYLVEQLGTKRAVLTIAAEKCFLERIENEHAQTIREAITFLNNGGYFTKD